MTIQRADDQGADRSAANAQASGKREFPVREYIGAMAVELAQMARWDGDEALGRILDGAAALAAEPLARMPIEIVEPVRVGSS